MQSQRNMEWGIPRLIQRMYNGEEVSLEGKKNYNRSSNISKASALLDLYDWITENVSNCFTSNDVSDGLGTSDVEKTNWALNKLVQAELIIQEGSNFRKVEQHD
jgi:hypothetical protein